MSGESEISDNEEVVKDWSRSNRSRCKSSVLLEIGELLNVIKGVVDIE